MIPLFFAAALAAGPPEQQLLVTDREGRTYVGTTEDPGADPLVLTTPNGPVTIPRADIASANPFVLPKQSVSCCSAHPRASSRPGNEIGSILPGLFAVIVSMDAVPGWSIQGGGISPGHGSIVFADVTKRFPFYDGRKRHGRWVNELLVTGGYREDSETDNTSIGYGIGAGYQVTFWCWQHLGIRFQLVIDESWWRHRGYFSDPGGTRVARIEPFTTFGRTGIGLAF